MASITGTNANDNLTPQATAAADTIDALGGDDILFGGDGADIYNGGAGNDRLDVTAQSQIALGETYNGGSGFDTLFLNTGSAIDLSLATINADVEFLQSFGIVALTSAQLGNFSRIETGAISILDAGVADLTGAIITTGTFNLSNFGNTLNLTGVSSTGVTVNGGALQDIVTGTASGDALNGNGGNDNMQGGDGNDTLFGGADADLMGGGNGNDTFLYTASAEIAAGELITGGLGFDRVFLQTPFPVDISAININADIEHLQASGEVLATVAQLSNFRNLQTGRITVANAGTVNLAGDIVSTNNFQLSALGNTFTLLGVADTNYTVTGGAGNDTITGGDRVPGGDALLGASGNDIISGGFGDDAITGGDGRDVMNGGDGNDTFVVANQTELAALETFNGDAGIDTIQAGFAVDLSAVTIGATTEAIQTFGNSLIATAAQLNAIRVLNSGAVTVSTAGAISFTGDTINPVTFNLSNLGNTITFAGNFNQNHTVNGGNAADVITGGDRVAGGDGLFGGGGNDTLVGGFGNDFLNGGAGRDNYNGGFGDDFFRDDVFANWVAGEVFAGGTGFDTIEHFGFGSTPLNLSLSTIGTDVEELDTGSFTPVILTGAQVANLTNIFTGAVTISTAGAINAANSVTSGQNFILNAGGNAITFAGTTNSGITITGGLGIDNITGTDSTASFDVLIGGGGADTITAGAGNDVINGGAAADIMNAGNGNDTFQLSAVADLVATESYTGGLGFDIINTLVAGSYNFSTATIAADVESLRANNGGTTYTLTSAQLGATQDIRVQTVTLSDGGIADLAGSFVQVATFNLNALGNTINLTGVQDGQYAVNGGVGIDTITGGEHVFGDTLLGGGGNDIIDGRAGDDLIRGGAGVDTVSGGAGHDTLQINAAGEIAAGEIYNGGTGSDTLNLNVNINAVFSSSTINVDIERFVGINAGANTVTFTGDQLGNFQFVQSGRIVINVGNADLSGATVFAPLITLNTGAGINLSGVTSQAMTIAGGTAANVIVGTDLGDTITGDAGDDTISGASGNDTITGGAGRDTINGGDGNDRFVIANAADIVLNESYTGGFGFDTLDLETALAFNISTLIVNADVESLESGGAVTLTAAQLGNFSDVRALGAITLSAAGVADLSDATNVATTTFNLSAAGNTLNLSGLTTAAYFVFGGAGADTILGSDRADQITGAGGVDILTGGGLGDQFRFNAVAGSNDTITDFSGITAFSGAAGEADKLVFLGLQAGVFSYVGAAAFVNNANSQARFAAANTLEVDANGDGVSDITLTLNGFTAATQLVTGDFIWS